MATAIIIGAGEGLSASLARKLYAQGIHTGHFVIDGGIRNANRPERMEVRDKPDSMLDPDAIADTYLHSIDQPHSSWAWEIELRPWVEKVSVGKAGGCGVETNNWDPATPNAT